MNTQSTSWLYRLGASARYGLMSAQRLLPLRWQSQRSILEHRAIPEHLWRQTTRAFPFLTWRDQAQQQRLRELSTLFLARKQFVPAGGLLLSDEMAVAIAAQACLPILGRGLNCYDSFTDIVIHPGQVIAQRETVDDSGVVHHYEEILAGESMPGGPIMLSWQDVRQAQDVSLGYNVVVHEFVHVLDMLDGEIDGIPPLPSNITEHEWTDTLWQAFDRHSEALARGDVTWLDPYAVESDLTEFFPVVTEAFFVAPQRLQQEFGAVYALLSRYFGEDTATHAPDDMNDAA